MAVFWLQPLAWWGLAGLAIPILIHLLVRKHSRRVPFPSLRFLRVTRLAAVRRHVISDWPLLAIRLVILTAAAAALAAPVFVSAARTQSWNARVARAIVVFSSNADVGRLVAEERAGSFAAAVFPTATPADGIRDAAAWLQRQPPAAREVVLVGDFRAGSLAGRDFDPVAPSTGVRLLPVVPADRARATPLTAIAETAPGEGAAPLSLEVTLDDEATTVSRVAGSALTRSENTERTGINDPPERPEAPNERSTEAARDTRALSPVAVRAAPDEQARAEAALRAVLAEGIILPRQRDRRVVIDFEGAPDGAGILTQPATQAWMRQALEGVPDLRGGERESALVVQTATSGADARAVHLIARIVGRAFADDLRDLEPRVIPASTLAAWSRPPGAVPDDVLPGDEGDRRVFWAAALALLAIEHLMRRSRAMPTAAAAEESKNAEVRVA